jgi:hypothetical protein
MHDTKAATGLNMQEFVQFFLFLMIRTPNLLIRRINAAPTMPARPNTAQAARRGHSTSASQMNSLAAILDARW